MNRPEFPFGKLTLLQTANTSVGLCDLCLENDKVYHAKEFYKDEDNNGWAICEYCKEELEMEGIM